MNPAGEKYGLQTIYSHVLFDHNVDDYLTGITCQIGDRHNRSTIFTPARQLKTEHKKEWRSQVSEFSWRQNLHQVHQDV